MSQKIKIFDGSFYKKRGHAVTAAVGFLFLVYSYILGYAVDVSFLADLGMLTVTLATLPRIKMNGKESSNKLATNLFGYVLLATVICISVLDAYEIHQLDPLTKVEFFGIITLACAGLFGVSKIDLSRTGIDTIKTAFNWKRERNQERQFLSTEQGGDSKNELEKEIADLQANGKYNTTTILGMMNSFKGMCEIKGAEHNQRLIQLAREAGFGWYNRDEIPWCAVMMNIVMHSLGLPTTGSAMAKSFSKWGRKLTLEEAKGLYKQGNVIAVSHRGDSISHPSGHVTAVEEISEDDSYYIGLGGNQGDCVKSSKYPMDWRINGSSNVGFYTIA